MKRKIKAFLVICCLAIALTLCLTACGNKCEHVYDNACDVTCNECNEERTITHTWKNADCTTPKTCTVCGATEGEVLGHEWTTPDVDLCEVESTCSRCGATDGENKEHSPETDDGDCTTEVKCTVCGDVTTPAGQHTPNEDDGDCTTPITCSVCGTVTTEAKNTHTPNADDGDCTTAITCKDCGTITTAGKASHTPNADDNDCTTAVTCKDCDTVTTPAGQHTPNNDDGDCTTPITCSVCGTTTTPAKDNHTGGTATCTEKAKCTACGTAYGTVDANNHIDENTDHICDRECGKTDIGTHADSNTDHACDYGCSTTIGTHADTNNDHNCEYGCSTTIGVHSDSENDDDHTCDYGCGATLEDHAGGTATCTAKAECTICGNVYGELDPDNHIDSNKDHICDRSCGETNIGTHEDKNNDHNCDYGCTTSIGTHSDSENDDDHTCDYGCGATLEDHAGGTATCLGYKCVVCGAWYGDKDADNHASTTEFTYTDNDNGTHKKLYACCGAVHTADEACSGGTATCSSGKICETCGGEYGELNADAHSFDETTGFCTLCGGYQPAVLTTDKYDVNGDEVMDEVYEISNAGQLYWFAAVVNGGYGDVGQKTWANAVLTENITINTGVLKADGSLNTGTFTEWTPIGNRSADQYRSFSGTFDGNGHSISGIYINGTSDYQGLFGEVGLFGTVKNVTVSDSYIKGRQYVGGVVGVNSNSIVQNCHNSGTVSGGDYVGGVVGDNIEGFVQNCHNSGAVSGSVSVGGVVGVNSNGTVQNCYNTGAVSGTFYLGGVVGYNNSYDNGGTVQNCYNTGVVSGSVSVGGVVGRNNSGTVQNCYNTGAVSGGDYVGGVVGDNSGTAANCYFLQTTDINADLSGIGDLNDTGVSNEGAAPMTAAQFKSGEVAYLLNGDQSTIVFMQTLGTDDYPNFTGAKVYYGYNSCTETATKIYTNDSTVSAEKPHSGGTATCSSGKICETCGGEYGELNPDNHASTEFTYTDNLDGTHAKAHKCCDAVVNATETHTIKDHVCTACGAMELAVSFETYNHEWKTGDQIKLTSETEDENGNTVSTEYYLTASVADDGTVTWTPDKALYWNGTGKHNLYVTYPNEGQYDSFVIPADQSTPENLRKADLLNAMWSGDPTTDTITFNLVHRLAKIYGYYYIGSEFEGYASFALKVYSNTQYLYFDGTTLERKDVAVQEGDGIWITPYLSESTSNPGRFTAYIAPGTYNMAEMLQFYVDGKLVSFTRGFENWTFGEGDELYIGEFDIGKDKVTIEYVDMNDIDFPFGDGWNTEVNLDGSTGTIGTTNSGKTAWAKDDQIIITLTSQKYGKQVAVITYNGEYWSTDVSLSYLENETFTVTAVYAPSSTLGMGEYIPATTTIEGNILKISFESGRTYSRLRIVGLPNQTLTVTTTGFTPAGASAAADGTTYTVTTNGDGNAYLYGTFAEGATVSVKYGDVVLKDYTFTAENNPNGTEQGKSYALDARPIIDGTFGGKTTATEEDITALVEQIKTYVDNGITTITVTGSNPAIIDMGTYTSTAIGEAIYYLSEEASYNGKIDLILPDVTEIVEKEFMNAYALNSITLPNVTKLGYRAFYDCQYLKKITFGSVVTEGSPSVQDFNAVGEAVGGCDLVLNAGQINAATDYQPDTLSNVWWKTNWKYIELW